jgi:hypothetical protein
VALYIHWNGNEPTAGNSGRLFTMPSTSGVVFEENVGASANSSNMVLEYEGPSLSLGLHKARVTALHVEVEPHAGTFGVEMLTDGVSQGSITLDIGSGLYSYGSSNTDYGTATYGGASRVKKFTPLPLRSEGQTITLRTIYTGQERFRHFTYTAVIVPEPAPRQL